MNKIIRSVTALVLILMGLVSCEKEFEKTAVVEDISNSAFIKVVHAAPSIRALYNLPDSFNFYVNNQKVSPAFLTYNSIFPSVSNTYIAVPSGSREFRLTVNGRNTPDSITIATMQKTLEAGAYYTFTITDSIKSARDSSQIFVRDQFPENIAPGFLSMRFIHAVVNDSTGKNVDIFSARRNGVIFPNVKPGTITNFTTLPHFAGVNDTLIVKRTGTNFELARLNGVSFGSQRVYTLIYRGAADSIPTKKYGRGLVVSLNK